MPNITGGCLCGQVRYSGNADPVFTGICHCTDCQKFSGAPFVTVIGVPKAALTITGTPKTFTKPGDSGKAMSRHFCPNCGSSIADEAEAMPDIVMVAIGTLDDSRWVKPAMQIYCDRAQPWVQLGGEMKSFARAPTN